MGCNCKNASNFEAELLKAAKKTTETGKNHVVWVRNINGVKYAYMGNEEEAEHRMKEGVICCYYYSDCSEVRELKKKRKKATKKVEIPETVEVENIDPKEEKEPQNEQ